MAADLTAGVVRVLKGGAIIGTGFILSDRGLIATCAHVVQEAGSGPGGDVTIQFQGGSNFKTPGI